MSSALLAPDSSEAPVFEAWPKTPRWFRNIVVTEKIDGTNACVVVSEADEHGGHVVFAQSRKRVVTRGSDNFGFGGWVEDNAAALAAGLGPGRHYGEWYGSGIGRRYGLDRKFFMPFNADRWTPESVAEAGLDAVGVRAPTVLYSGPNRYFEIDSALRRLDVEGSAHVPGWDGEPEGICIFHVASRQVFKVTLENDDTPKSVAA